MQGYKHFKMRNARNARKKTVGLKRHLKKIAKREEEKERKEHFLPPKNHNDFYIEIIYDCEEILTFTDIIKPCKAMYKIPKSI